MSLYRDLAEHYEAIFPFRPDVFAFLRRHLPDDTRSVLDAGCGTGHYCGRFAADGFDAVGIDLDPDMIRVARERYPQATFRCQDILEIDTLDSSVDAIFCVGNVAAHLTREQFGTLLARLRRRLRARGAWIFQVVNWDAILERDSYRFPPKTVGSAGLIFHREYRDITDQRLRFCSRLESSGQTIFAGETWLYPLRAAAYLDLHRKEGFELTGHFADYQETEFDPRADSASILVFRKR